MMIVAVFREHGSAFSHRFIPATVQVARKHKQTRTPLSCIYVSRFEGSARVCVNICHKFLMSFSLTISQGFAAWWQACDTTRNQRLWQAHFNAIDIKVMFIMAMICIHRAQFRLVWVWFRFQTSHKCGHTSSTVTKLLIMGIVVVMCFSPDGMFSMSSSYAEFKSMTLNHPKATMHPTLRSIEFALMELGVFSHDKSQWFLIYVEIRWKRWQKNWFDDSFDPTKWNWRIIR